MSDSEKRREVTVTSTCLRCKRRFVMDGKAQHWGDGLRAFDVAGDHSEHVCGDLCGSCFKALKGWLEES